MWEAKKNYNSKTDTKMYEDVFRGSTYDDMCKKLEGFMNSRSATLVNTSVYDDITIDKNGVLVEKRCYSYRMNGLKKHYIFYDIYHI